MDNGNIHKVEYSADDLTYQIATTRQFVWEQQKSLLNDFSQLDWAHAHITDRSITFGGIIYKIENKQEQKMVPPQYYFGEEHREEANDTGLNSEDSDLEELSDDDLKELERQPYF